MTARKAKNSSGLSVALAMTVILVSVSATPNGTRAFQTQADPKLDKILATIAKTSSEGLKILRRIQELKPEVNDVESSKTLIDIVQDYAFNSGAAYSIEVIGWAAWRKEVVDGEAIGRWSIVLFYKDWQKEHRSAEWEYNDETDRLTAFETENAPTFWFNEQPAKKRNKP